MNPVSVPAIPSVATSLPSAATTSGTSGRSVSADSAAAQGAEQEEKLLKQFESVMLSMVLKQMRQTGTGEEGLFPGDSSDTLGGMFDMYLGEHLAESGGFGLMDAFQGRLLSGPQTLSPQQAGEQIRQQATEAYRHVSTTAVQ
ncbi:MAG: rod-binding protein [Planctomycetaceae bacterium]|nr:rod-binding protein [Planctomycetaceae bacterium]